MVEDIGKRSSTGQKGIKESVERADSGAGENNKLE